MAWRFDGTRVRRLHALAAIPVCVAAIWLATLVRGERMHDEMFEVNSRVALFFASWTETSEALWRGRVVEAAATPGGAPFQIPAACHPSSKPPHIILIHQESVAQPSQFPALGYDKSVDTFFRSADGKLHKLRVETYGGASWLTEFSVLTGLSTHPSAASASFSSRSWPARCAIRCRRRWRAAATATSRSIRCCGLSGTTGSSPRRHSPRSSMPRTSAPSSRTSATASISTTRSRAERHLQDSQQPIFLFVETMAAHGSYDYAYMPEVKVREAARERVPDA